MNNCVYQGHVVRKRFGQYFLNNNHIVNNIVTAIHPKRNEAMVEIGPGLGALTKPVSRHLNTLTVIELDHDLVARLHTDPFFGQKLIIYQQDVMAFNFSNLAKEKGRPLRIFGNLPYNISTPLMFRLFSHIHAIKDMHFLLQKEVANRLIARPNSKTYGRLSVIAQYYCRIILILEVPPESFIPVPKVNSAVVHLIPHTVYPHPITDVRILHYITAEAFNKRRKTLRNSLGHLFSTKIMKSLEIDNQLRAENLTVTKYCQLANWLMTHTTLS